MAKGHGINVNNAKECGHKGGIKSGEVRRRKREMKDILSSFLSMPYTEEDLEDIEKSENFKALAKKNMTIAEKLMFTQILKAMKGDTVALQFIRDTSGQKPSEKMQLEAIPVPIFGGEDKLED